MSLTERGVLTVSHPVGGREECLRLRERETSSSLCGVNGPRDCCWRVGRGRWGADVAPASWRPAGSGQFSSEADGNYY